MNKFIWIAATLLLCIFSLDGYSQVDYSWTEKAPYEYQPKSTEMIISSASPCNQGEEAFKDFIPKFRTDPEFRKSRFRMSENDQPGILSFIGLEGWNDGNGYALIKAFKKNLKCNKSFGTWYNVSANEVCFQYSDVLPCDEWGGSGFMVQFYRINGKWYLIGCLAAG